MNNLKNIVLAAGKTEMSQSQSDEGKPSPRQKGMRQGIVLMGLSVILIPAYILLAALFPANDRLVESSVSDTPFEKISQAILFTLFMCGLARILYARLFQQGGGLQVGEAEVPQLDGSSSKYALPPAQSVPISSFGTWRTNTGEVVQAPSVKERTTSSLGKD